MKSFLYLKLIIIMITGCAISDENINDDDPFDKNNIINNEASNDEYINKMNKIKIDCLEYFLAYCRNKEDNKTILIERRYGNIDKDERHPVDNVNVSTEKLIKFIELMKNKGEYVEDSEAEVFCEIIFDIKDSKYRYYLILPSVTNDVFNEEDAIMRVLYDEENTIDMAIKDQKGKNSYFDVLVEIVPKFKNMEYTKKMLENNGYKNK